jgi:hypothetical protein
MGCFMQTRILTDNEIEAIAFGRLVTRDLIDFNAYFCTPQRFRAVDDALCDNLRVRVELIAEHIDALEHSNNVHVELINALSAVSSACRDMVVQQTLAAPPQTVIGSIDPQQ